MQDRQKLARFQQSILPHMDAAYNLARWLTRDTHDAEDVVQEAFLRAFRFFDGFRGEDGRHWVLKIVRNTFYTWKEQNRRGAETYSMEDLPAGIENELAESDEMVHRSLNVELLSRVLGELPVEFREVLVLRELEGFSYKEIAGIAEVPIGTVMSRLSRARKLLENRLTAAPAAGDAA
ncbi:MAG TPA: sigma-70 family RNA polymerase sigma factor [Gammaproteobacteria bacterium]|nr:sigma-70 family RNA polymerase sigma factor [Gammaproteobacteria bacterium]